MPNSLEGKIAVVTGVSQQGQIGETVAKALADRGAALAICARTQSSVEARAAELRQTGARVLVVAASLTEESGANQLIEATIKEYGRIDVLVNLAGGLTRYKPAIEHSLEDWNIELSNNLLSAFLVSREVLPHMQAAGGGVIINFARAGLSQPNMVAYNCAKAGIEALTRTLALEGRELRYPRQCRGARTREYGVQHCGDETKRSEALDQTRRYRRGGGFPRVASGSRHYRAGHNCNRLGTLNRLCVESDAEIRIKRSPCTSGLPTFSFRRRRACGSDGRKGKHGLERCPRPNQVTQGIVVKHLEKGSARSLQRLAQHAIG